MAKKKKRSYHDIVGGSKPTLVDFYATWCGPCQMMPPVLKQLRAKMGDSVNILKIDVDKNQALAHKLNVRGVPTLMIYKYGKVLWRESGVKTAKALEKVLADYLEESTDE